MPKKEIAPPVRGISASDFKNRKRLINILADQRIGYGKSALCNTENHQWRYPIDIAASALQKAEKKARAIGRTLDFSKEETDLISQIFRLLVIAGICCAIFSIDNDHDGIADLIEIFLQIGFPGSYGTCFVIGSSCVSP